ncbi:uncharacterized protein A1O9_00868 [Exophiala aquamarina CBS 119918]|uniref:Dienelactone hydrolase domain-containing protein n=1 Tax=Exophiala aquamarina CBS 119918 TaxID=1182545 RepID=A0A072PS22_9EURO|nr:uncharacterized protein A1O9_00868 [Exophiala aquamarina CBS 119918]KEF62894.1 hypothetical protein A1O9_00868 [Exophiala aquamarina CBS 119918]
MACSQCFQGTVKAGTARGSEIDYHGYKAYVVTPSANASTRRAVQVIISDAFGWATPNIRLLADSYADRTGMRVYVPDFMDGTAAPQWLMKHTDRIQSEGGWYGWLVKPWLVLNAGLAFAPFFYRNSPPSRYSRVTGFLEQLRNNSDAGIKVGVVGFCWGGYHVTRLAHGEVGADGRALIDAGFSAHPSALTIPKDIEGITLPYSVAVGDEDFALGPKLIQQLQDVLKSKKDVDSEVVVLRGAKHGFAVRADPADEAAMQASRDAEDQMAQWFERFLV